ncbi:DUF2321 domain-containing protein [Beduinella massiliensis]|uniref:DUF2321 domain-containing protein n=1 Tax=Beduinella massiliensis TaxID=1852363 RepID=UPI0031F741FD
MDICGISLIPPSAQACRRSYRGNSRISSAAIDKINATPEKSFSNVLRHVHKLDVPKYCTCCGAPFPWTVSLLSNAATIVEEDEYMSDEERRIMSLSFHDLVIESPETTLATIRFKKCLSTCGEITRKAFQSLIVKFACDTALKLLGL